MFKKATVLSWLQIKRIKQIDCTLSIFIKTPSKYIVQKNKKAKTILANNYILKGDLIQMLSE